MYKINDVFSTTIEINGNAFPIDAGNALTVLHIHASSTPVLPLIHLQLLDGLQVMPKFGLTDGAKLKVVIKGSTTETRYFRVHSWIKTPMAQGFTYTIDGYWDAPKWIAGSTNKGVYGTSGVVISKLASACGLKFFGSPLVGADSMTWVPGNKTYGEFAKSIARHGYCGPNSHMVLAVDSIGYVRYKDITPPEKAVTRLGYLKQDNNFITINDFRPTVKSGLNNMLGGYQHTRYIQSIKTTKLESSVSPRWDAKFPLVNTDVRSTISNGLKTFSPIDAGNVHDSYDRARYQNSRLDLVKSLQGEFLIPVQSALEAFDVVNFNAPSGHQDAIYDGDYILQGKVIMIAGSSYQEKLIGLKNGLK